jgi:hypothetical protein
MNNPLNLKHLDIHTLDVPLKAPFTTSSAKLEVIHNLAIQITLAASVACAVRTIYIQWLLSAVHLFPGTTYFFTVNTYQRQRVLTGLPFPGFHRLGERDVCSLHWAEGRIAYSPDGDSIREPN